MADSNGKQPIKPKKSIRKLGKNRTKCIGNGGGLTDFLPKNTYNNTSDTELETDDKDFARYLKKSPLPERPATTVFGPGMVVTYSNPTSLSIQSVEVAKDNVHYPTLPLISPSPYFPLHSNSSSITVEGTHPRPIGLRFLTLLLTNIHPSSVFSNLSALYTA